MRVGIFADLPSASTGFAVVCSNIARELADYYDLEIYYFGRYGRKQGFARKAIFTEDGYYYVPCVGGVWDYNYLNKLIKKWKIETMFSEDDWFSSQGLISASRKNKIPLHFYTPIDCLPLPEEAFKKLNKCSKVYTPNSSYKILRKRNINAFYLPHGVDLPKFFPFKKEKKATFVWMGRNEERKNLLAFIHALHHLIKKEKKKDVKAIIRTDWIVPTVLRVFTDRIIRRLDLEKNIIKEQTKDISHEQMRNFYNNGEVYVNTSCAGGFELGIIEANACGLPAVVTNWRFMNENVLDGVNGWLVNVEKIYKNPFIGNGKWGKINVEDLSKTLLFIVENLDSIRKMALQCRMFVSQRYSWKKTAKLLYTHLTKE